MKVSIALATYNGGKYLSEQLASLENQSRVPDEVVISDDLSTDNTISIIENFVANASFDVKVLLNEKNLGYAQNFNQALCATTGDLVFLCDQDDVWFENKIESMLSLVREHQDKLLFMNDAMITDTDLQTTNNTKYQQIQNAGLGDNRFVMGCCCCIKRELLDYCLPIPQGLNAHDNWLVNIADGLKTKLINKEALQYYRRHGENESDFIGNSIEPIDRMTIYKKSVKDYLLQQESDGEVAYQQTRIFKAALSNVKNKLPEKHHFLFEIMITEFATKLSLLDKRRYIKDQIVLKRIFLIIPMIFKDYPRGKKISHAIRDLLG